MTGQRYTGDTADAVPDPGVPDPGASAAGVQVGVLGPLVVHRDGAEVPVKPAKVAALLACLAWHEGRAVPASRIEEVLWGESPPATSRDLVHTYVSRLRKQLRGSSPVDPVVREPAGYRLDLAPGALDLARFGAAAAAARAAAAAVGDPAAPADAPVGGDVGAADSAHADAAPAAGTRAALARCTEALALWRGRGPADVDDTVRLLPEVAAAVALRTETVLLLADLCLRTGHARAAVPELRREADENPFDETVHARLMHVLVAAGDRVGALEVYRQIWARLDGRGLDPHGALQAAQRLALEAPDPSATPTPPRAPAPPRTPEPPHTSAPLHASEPPDAAAAAPAPPTPADPAQVGDPARVGDPAPAGGPVPVGGPEPARDPASATATTLARDGAAQPRAGRRRVPFAGVAVAAVAALVLVAVAVWGVTVRGAGASGTAVGTPGATLSPSATYADGLETFDRDLWGVYSTQEPFENGSMWVGGAVHVDDGLLQVVAEGDDPTGAGNVSGGACWRCVHGEQTLQYGVWEVRARFDAGAGYTPEIGLWPNADDDDDDQVALESVHGAFAVRAEDPDRGSLTSVIAGPGGTSRDGATVVGDYTRWATYRFEWYPDHASISVDGTVLVDTRTTGEAVEIPTGRMFLYVQYRNGPADGASAANASTPDEVALQVDWVRYTAG